jgi:adenosylhomocysteine nucleosidase
LESDYPLEVYRTLIVSGDKDLAPEDIKNLKSKYRAVAGDWESGAIAHTAVLNKTRILILRGVTDLVGENGGEAYGNAKVFEENTSKILGKLVESLPQWIMISNVF